jgi:hypothetical protein
MFLKEIQRFGGFFERIRIGIGRGACVTANGNKIIPTYKRPNRKSIMIPIPPDPLDWV